MKTTKWTKPEIREIEVGMEINAYACAELAPDGYSAIREVARDSAPELGGRRRGHQGLERHGA